ncbi:MAG: hypothetical protein ACKOEQ_00210 [Verrucomicrobiota bacterium]
MDRKGDGSGLGWRRRVAVSVAGLACAMAAWTARGQTIGLFTFPHVDAHGRGIPGVTRPMLMAGPGMLGMGMGAGMGVPVVNPNWTGAAAMFAPELLMGRGMMPGVGGAMGAPGNGASSMVPGNWGKITPGPPAAGERRTDVAAHGTGTSRLVKQGPPSAALVRRDEASADARLLAFQQAEARKGLPGAQRALADRYEKGNGVERSEELARAWRMAAERAEAAAMLP